MSEQTTPTLSNGYFNRASVLAYVLEVFHPASADDALVQAERLWRWTQMGDTARALTGLATSADLEEGAPAMGDRDRPLPRPRPDKDKGVMPEEHRRRIREGLRRRQERLAKERTQRGPAGRLKPAAIEAKKPEVLALRAANPKASQRAIARRLGLSQSTVARLLVTRE